MEESKLNIAQMREKFEEKIRSIELSSNSVLIPSVEAYEKIIGEVERAKAKKSKRTLTDCRRLLRYDVILEDDCKKLIRPLSGDDKVVRSYVHNDQLFDIVHSSHLATGHGGRNNMEHDIRMKYANVTRNAIKCYLDLCLDCKTRKAQKREINECAQLDLIDMQAGKDNKYRFILNYQEDSTKFIFLRPMKTNTVAEVANNLIDIFCLIGTPSVLQSDIEEEFCNSVILEVAKMWPNLQITHEKMKEESIENVSFDIQVLLAAWMQENKIYQWSEGLRFCQWKKNNIIRSNAKQSPYVIMFGKN